MNMQNLMAQAQKIQKDIQKKQDEINSTVFTTKNEFVEVEMYGSKKIKKIKILKDTLNDADDIETLEDMLQLAFNESVTKIEQEKEKKLGAYANGLNGLL
ncbi:MAG: YbaB/EbfC family nucleoid-associated protein [Tenericutes bacterium]|nr:YbaB/EbfC family nucleoid-associated protein [Mycoplasmatota bacterium]